MTVPVRRFEPGATVDYMADFMERCGYQVSSHVGRYKVKKIGARGPGKLMTRAKVLELFDQERAKRGLEPIRRESSAIKSTVSQRFTKNTQP